MFSKLYFLIGGTLYMISRLRQYIPKWNELRFQPTPHSVRQGIASPRAYIIIGSPFGGFAMSGQRPCRRQRPDNSKDRASTILLSEARQYYGRTPDNRATVSCPVRGCFSGSWAAVFGKGGKCRELPSRLCRTALYSSGLSPCCRFSYPVIFRTLIAFN